MLNTYTLLCLIAAEYKVYCKNEGGTEVRTLVDIGLAQELLEKDYPQISGFQSTLLSQNDGFVPVKSDSDHFNFIIQMVITGFYQQL